jgi:hypothetical protein
MLRLPIQNTVSALRALALKGNPTRVTQHFEYLLLRLFLLISCCLSANGLVRAQLVESETGRLESEYKLAVPEDIAPGLWIYLQEHFATEKVAAWDNRLTTTSSEELFIDTYFDNEEKVMLANQVGVRFRQRYIDDELAKELIQIKLPSSDSTGVARTEQKFEYYKEKKKSDRKAMHAFWQFVRPKDRADVNLHLAPFRVQGDDLKPSIKMQQLRQRIYFQQDGEALMTITLDKAVYYYFPYPTFTEMEMELNEIRYTESDATERLRMETLNKKLKEELMQTFPRLVQDQTPKYNKMYALVRDSWLAQIYSRLQYVILGLLVTVALVLFFIDRKKKVNLPDSLYSQISRTADEL